MRPGRKILAGLFRWTGVVTAAHLTLNFDWSAALNDRLPLARRSWASPRPVTYPGLSRD